jgi:hypothetical protein
MTERPIQLLAYSLDVEQEILVQGNLIISKRTIRIQPSPNSTYIDLESQNFKIIDELLISVKDAALKYGLTKRRLQDMCKRQRLQAIRDVNGRRWLIFRDSLERHTLGTSKI